MAGSSKQFFKYTVVENVIGNIAQKTDILKLYLITKKFEVFLERLLFVLFQNKGGFDNPAW